jgi:membrane protease YdiL (CAAX protease family)
MVNPLWNAGENRPRTFFRLAAFGMSFLFFTISVLLFLFIPALLFFPDQFYATELTVRGPGAEILTYPALALGTLAALAFNGRIIDRRPFANFGLNLRRGWWLDFCFGLLLGAGLICAIFAAMSAAGWVTISGANQAVRANTEFIPGLLEALLIFICIGLYEECFFRGYILRNLAEGLRWPGKISPRLAVLLACGLSSVLFGLLHGANPNASLVSTINVCLAGVFLSLGYILTGELAIPIGLHITWNFFQGSVFGFAVSGTTPIASLWVTQVTGPVVWTGGAFGPEAGLLGVLAILLGIGLTLLWVRWRSGKVRLYNSLAVYEPLRKR